MLRTVKVVSEELRWNFRRQQRRCPPSTRFHGGSDRQCRRRSNLVKIDPTSDYNATLTAINQTIDGYPGLEHETQTYLQEALSKFSPGQGVPSSCASEALIGMVFTAKREGEAGAL